jgi:hypothetical protein
VISILAALVDGTTDPGLLADLARGILRKKRPVLREALRGRFRAHHGFLVAQILAHLDYLDEVIATVSHEVAASECDTAAHRFYEEVAQLAENDGMEPVRQHLGLRRERDTGSEPQRRRRLRACPPLALVIASLASEAHVRALLTGKGSVPRVARRSVAGSGPARTSAGPR